MTKPESQKTGMETTKPVSYTHLDVYKRQVDGGAAQAVVGIVLVQPVILVQHGDVLILNGCLLYTSWGEYARTLPVCLVFWNGLYYTVGKHICKIYVSHAKYLYLIWQNAGKEEKL